MQRHCTKKRSLACALVAAAAACGAGAAHAQVAGDVMVQLGWDKIMPKVKSGDLSQPSLPGTKIDIKSASALFATLTYMVTDDISVEVLGGAPYKHDIVGAGAVSGIGKIGSVHQVAPTVLLQYRFLPADAPLRPYVGAGPTFAKFYGTKGSGALTAVTNPGGPPTTIGGDTEWGGTIEAGANYKIDKHWFIDAAILKTFISTKATLSTGQSTSAKLNPIAINASIGYTF
jgi:outer membrane protein